MFPAGVSGIRTRRDGDFGLCAGGGGVSSWDGAFFLLTRFTSTFRRKVAGFLGWVLTAINFWLIKVWIQKAALATKRLLIALRLERPKECVRVGH